jgi:hypothetical protein
VDTRFVRRIEIHRRIAGFLALICADLLIGAIVYASVNPGNNLLVYVDLGGLYGYSFPNVLWFGSVALYPSSQQLLFLGLGPVLAQNLWFLCSLLVPSIFLYLLFTEIDRKILKGLALSLIFGTILNPLYYIGLVGGGYEYGLWMGLTFASIWALVKARRTNSPWYVVGAAVLYGLSVTQSVWTSAADSFAILLTGPLVLSLLIWSAGPRLSRGNVKTLRWATAFLGVTLAITLPVLLLRFGEIGSLSVAPSSFSVPNAEFTFRFYGWVGGLLSIPPNPKVGNWTLLPIWPFTLIVVTAIVGSTVAVLSRPQSNGPPVAIFLGWYLTLALLISLVSEGPGLLLYQVALFTPLQNPIPLLWAQAVCLPFMLNATLSSVGSTKSGWLSAFDRMFHRWFHSNASGPRQARARDLLRRLGVRAKKFDEPDRAATIVALFLGLLLIAGMAGPIASVRSTMVSSPWLGGETPFVPGEMASLHTWYSTNYTSGSGQVAILPNSYHTYNAISAFIPLAVLWVIQASANYFFSADNVTRYSSVMDLALDPNGTPFARTLAVSGVEYVLVLNGTGNVTLIPSYLGQSLEVERAVLIRDLNQTNGFVLAFSDSVASIFRDVYFQPTGMIASRVIAGYGWDYQGPATWTAPLKQQTFSNWTGYPNSSVLRNPNGTALLNVGNQTSPGVTLWSDIFAGSPFTGLGTANISVDPEFVTDTLSINDTTSIGDGVGLQVLLYWYNTTSPPSFYGTMAVSTVADLNAGVQEVSKTVVIPVGTKLARMVFFAYPINIGGLGSAFLSFPTVTLSELPAELSDSAPVQYDLICALICPSQSASAAIILAYPTVTTSVVASQTTEVAYAVPAVVLDATGSNVVTLINGTSGLPLSAWLRSFTPSGIVLFGYSNFSGSPTKISLFTNQGVINSSVGYGAFELSIALPSSWAGKSVFLAVTGSVTLSFVGYHLLRAEPAPIAAVFDLPIGELDLHRVGSGWNHSWSFPPAGVEQSWQYPSLITAEPLLCIVSLGVLWIAIHLRPSRLIAKLSGVK